MESKVVVVADIQVLYKIINRALDKGYVKGNARDAMFVLDCAALHYGMRLDLWLEADDFNFAHDWFGIMRHFNDKTCKFDDRFLPRFAKDGGMT